MRDDFDANFAAAIAATHGRPFWSIVCHFDAGDVWLASRANTAGGNAHSVVLITLDPIGSIAPREFKNLDVTASSFEFLNMPMRSGAPGAIGVGQRFIDLWPRTMENVKADVYLNFQLPDSSYVQAIMFRAVL